MKGACAMIAAADSRCAQQSLRVAKLPCRCGGGASVVALDEDATIISALIRAGPTRLRIFA
jgi:hypothetical protein